ncbi:MAG: hypothetical protein NVS4B9_39770 [Ktedonobacteraceae bacterium]
MSAEWTNDTLSLIGGSGRTLTHPGEVIVTATVELTARGVI